MNTAINNYAWPYGRCDIFWHEISIMSKNRDDLERIYFLGKPNKIFIIIVLLDNQLSDILIRLNKANNYELNNHSISQKDDKRLINVLKSQINH